MRHWLTAVEFVTLLAVYAGFMWILLAFVVHTHRRLVIMLDAGWPGKHGYGWKDAGVLLRRKTKQKLGPEPGRHRAAEPQPPPARLVAITAGEPERPPSDVLVADLGAGTDLLDGGEALPEIAHDETMPGRAAGPRDPAHISSTMTMTQPVALPRWEGPGPPPPWYPQEGEE
jgi:hypothetical protein